MWRPELRHLAEQKQGMIAARIDLATSAVKVWTVAFTKTLTMWTPRFCHVNGTHFVLAYQPLGAGRPWGYQMHVPFLVQGTHALLVSMKNAYLCKSDAL